MKTFKWTDEAAGIVAVIDEDGISRQNGKVEALVPVAARGAIMAADPVIEPDQSEKLNALHDKAVVVESKLSEQDRALWQAQSPVLRALVSFLGIADGRIADIVAIARKLEGG